MDSQKVREEFSQPVIRLRERVPNRQTGRWEEEGERKRRRVEEGGGGVGGENALPSSSNPPSTASTITSTSRVQIIDPRDIRHPIWALDEALIAGFHDLDIKKIYTWQLSCLRRRGVLEGKNIVYTAPTSAGKSLVADFLMLRKVINEDKKAVVCVPYISIVQEKARFLRKVLAKLPNIKVGEFHHSSPTRLKPSDVHISICTIERANAILNTALKDSTIKDIGIFIFDELHMIGEKQGRGAILELLIAKIMAVAGEDIQIVGMSATLGNSRHLAGWMGAQHFESDFRPIELKEYLVCENMVYETGVEKALKRVPVGGMKELQMSAVKNATVALALDAVGGGYGVLVFCTSRKGTEMYAKLIAGFMAPPPPGIMEKRRDLIDSLRTTPAGLDPFLADAIQRGVAYHHAGLTTEERDIVSMAYDDGIIKLICCTPTMAAGVNLPARRVIIHPKTGKDLLSPIMLSQMRGRAGRKGKDTEGESFLCCEKNDLKEVRELTKMSMPEIKSALGEDSGREVLEKALLEAISTNFGTSLDSLQDFLQLTLLYYENQSPEKIQIMIQEALENLLSLSLIAPDPDILDHFNATPLGHATVSSSLNPADAVFLYSELSRSQASFNLGSELQIVYNLTPISSKEKEVMPNWVVLRKEFDKLDEVDANVAERLGLEPYFINKMAQGAACSEMERLRPYKRFWSALMLREMMSEARLEKVAVRFKVERAIVQNLASTCRGFAYTSVQFCRALGWGGLAVLLEHYSDRLNLGVSDDLMELAKLPFIKSFTARLFFKAGFTSVGKLANSTPEKLVPVLLEACPARIKGWHEGKALREMLLKRAEIIVKAANKVLESEQEQWNEYTAE